MSGAGCNLRLVRDEIREFVEELQRQFLEK